MGVVLVGSRTVSEVPVPAVTVPVNEAPAALRSVTSGVRKFCPVMVTVVGVWVVPAPGETVAMVGGGFIVTRKAPRITPPPPSGLIAATS
jgi:hypothetical protein